MQETLVQGKDWLAFIETQEGGQKPAVVARTSVHPSEHERHLDAWGDTDRPLTFPKDPRPSALAGNSNSPWLNPDAAGARSL